MCLCAQSDKYVLDLMGEKNYGKWYCEAKHCKRCEQRGVSLALDSDMEENIDCMLSWTDCHKYVMEVFLAACIKRKYNIIAYIIYLFDMHFLHTEEMFRVFCLKEFETEFERDLTIIMATEFEECYTIFLEIARILEVSPLALHDFMIELKDTCDD